MLIGVVFAMMLTKRLESFSGAGGNPFIRGSRTTATIITVALSVTGLARAAAAVSIQTAVPLNSRIFKGIIIGPIVATLRGQQSQLFS